MRIRLGETMEEAVRPSSRVDSASPDSTPHHRLRLVFLRALRLDLFTGRLGCLIAALAVGAMVSWPWAPLRSEPAIASDAITIELETAFKTGEVRGAEQPLHSMVASRGYAIGNGWGRGRDDRLEIPFETERDFDTAVLAIRYSALSRGASLGVEIRGAGDRVAWKGRLRLQEQIQRESFAVGTLALGALRGGSYSLELTPAKPGEILLDAASVSEANAIPPPLRRRLRFDRRGKGHFRIFFSPHTKNATLKRVDEVFERLEKVYEFLRAELGHEPPSLPLTFCVSAAKDSAGGAAHASGSTFFVDEEGLLNPESGNVTHEMTHCFQENYASNGDMPAWIREGEAFFACCLGDVKLWGKTKEEAAWPPFRGKDPEAIRRAGLDEFGINVAQYFRTERQPRENRPYYLIWNYVFYQLFLRDETLLRGFHDRLRKALRAKTYPLEKRDLRNPRLVSSVYIDYLVDGDLASLELLTRWGFVTWNCRAEAPAFGPVALRVECGVRGPAGQGVPWKRAYDRGRASRGFAYRVRNGLSWKEPSGHHWFFSDPRHGGRPMQVVIDVPAEFAGVAVLVPETGRSYGIRVDGDPRGSATYEREVYLAIRPRHSRDRKLEVELAKHSGLNGALAALRVHHPPALGKRVLDVACGAQAKRADGNTRWTSRADRVAEKAEGFAHRVRSGLAWTDGSSHQWFYHDRRYDNQPLEFELRVPKSFRGHLVIEGDRGGRVQEYLLNDERCFVGRGDGPVAIPIGARDTREGTLSVVARRLEGNNCAVSRIRLHAK